MMPSKSLAPKKSHWKAKVNGVWYEVEDVVDQGDGKPNRYFLKGHQPVEKIEDLDMASASVRPWSFLPKLQWVLARRDQRKALKKRDLSQKLQKEAEEKSAKKAQKKSSAPGKQQQAPQQQATPFGKNKYGVMDRKSIPFNPEPEVVTPEIMDDDEGAQNLPATQNDQKDGSKGLLERIQELSKPVLFIANFPTPEEKENFANNIKPLLVAGSAIPFFNTGTGTLVNLASYFAESSVAISLQKRAQNIPSMVIDTIEFDEDRPFSQVKFSTELSRSIDSQTTQLANELNQVWKNVHLGLAETGRVPALRMSSEIPLKYLRFLGMKNREYEYYIGDDPAGAGQDGAVYILADEQEIKLFTQTMKRFGPVSPNFFSDLYETSDIDADFKDFDPETIQPQNALILVAHDKFKLQGKVYDKEGNLMGQEDIQQSEHQEKPVDFNTTELDLLHEFAKEHLKNVQRPGKFLKMRLYRGDNIVHINKNENMIILWGSRSSVSLNKKTVLEHLPFVKDAIFTFMK